ncbi:putative HMP/thiamine import ATP-binding protein YkoD [Austwickia sp. TVS 96-490-7B]|uniref:ABC transporter ATP-binding protein n=1 Tax=Austwickia sp. TVS 96-490-7B TaxID=2830843 RepID=UPI001C5A4A76|nr:ATP-binding cassette domain-containing protein [Austwickia sp. TVS 96-490-7B]MBW3083969.1 putative HMP/thiamine import ATP-binding protein YkoD [Austwickia sp. TVS 96-490-7B]
MTSPRARIRPADGPRSGGARIDLNHLSWTPLGRRRPILDALDLHLEPGEKVLLAGASGAGKSTLLRAIAGVLDTVDPGTITGHVLINGTPAHAGDGRVGLMVQDPADSRVAGTIGRDIAFGPENLAVPRDDIAQRVRHALRCVHLPYPAHHATTALSGGESQRLALAGLIALQPQVILLDEPTSMLDEQSAAAVRRAVIDTVDGTGATLIVVEHRLDGWVDLVDRLVVLDAEGTVSADGPVQKVLDTHTATLLNAGVWVPGAPAPDLPALPDDLCRPWPGVIPEHLDVPLITGTDLTLRRRPRRGLRALTQPEPDILALTGVSTELLRGHALAVRGASGAGKSSLVGVLCGLDAPTSGEVRAASGFSPLGRTAPHRWSPIDVAARIGWIPQRAAMAAVGGHTVRDALLSTPRALGRWKSGAGGAGVVGDSGRAAEHRVDVLMDVLGIGHLARRHPHRLSGGEQRRLAVVAAVAHGPAVIGADEPTVGQDRHTWAAVAAVLVAARDAGCAVAVSTHDDALAAHADATLHLHAGAMRVAGGPQ